MCKKLIQELLDKELFLPIDLYFAHAFVSLDSSLSILIAYIFAMARQGHLCIRLENNKIAPSPALLFLEQAGLLEELIKLNFFSLPLHICQKIEREEEVPFTPFCIFKGALYLQKNWILQQEFIKHIRRLQKREVHSLPGIIPINSALNIEQKMAVQRALSSPISVISGGPGTGKTFTAAHIVQAFYQGLSDERKKTVQIKLAAPTGKAAALLEKNLQERLSHLPGISSGTLHSFLKSSGGFAQTLYADLLLVDEASMLDATLFVRMLKNLKAGGLIVLIGDKDQLPPVEAGGFFADLIDRSEDWNIPVTLLQKGLRAENKILDEVSKAILHKDIEKMKGLEGVHLVNSLRDPLLKKQIEEYCERYFFIPYQEGIDYKQVLRSMEQFRILSPLRKGALGVDWINQRVLETLQKQQGLDEKLICPILITKNDAQRNLMNGDTAILVARNSSLHKGLFTAEDKAYFLDKEGNLLEVAAPLLPDFSLAYCLSIHKSQGSEYDNVLVLLPSGSEKFGKEVLYTAATRAKKKLCLWADEKVLITLLDKSSRKISGFSCLEV